MFHKGYAEARKMKHDRRIAVRLPAEEKAKAKHLIQNGKFKNLSQVMRIALKHFLTEGDNTDAAK